VVVRRRLPSTTCAGAARLVENQIDDDQHKHRHTHDPAKKIFAHDDFALRLVEA
jgi:hypothetical protein